MCACASTTGNWNLLISNPSRPSRAVEDLGQGNLRESSITRIGGVRSLSIFRAHLIVLRLTREDWVRPELTVFICHRIGRSVRMFVEYFLATSASPLS